MIKGRTKTITYGYRVGNYWWPYKPEGADALLYHLPDVICAVEEDLTVVWTEGEKDADAVLEHSDYVATSHHGGAGKISAEQAEWFRGHRGLVLLAYDLDEDDPKTGGNPGAFDVMRRYSLLRAVGIARSQIAIVHAATGKDVADHLAAGYGMDDLVPVRSDDELAGLRVKANCTRGGSFRRYGYGTPR